MSESVVGIVEEVINNGKGKGSGVRILGHKYGVYDPADAGLDAIAEGTTVSLRFKEKDGGGGITYKNVQGKITTVKDGTPVTASPEAAPAGGTTGGSKYRKNGEEGGFPIHARAYERALDRRNALTNAVAMASYSTVAVSPEDIIELARKFEAYTTGDLEAHAEAVLAFEEDDID